MRTDNKQVRSQPNPVISKDFPYGTYKQNTTKSEKHLHYLAFSKSQQNKNPKTQRLRGSEVRHIQLRSRDTRKRVPALLLCGIRKFIIRAHYISLKTVCCNIRHATKCDKTSWSQPLSLTICLRKASWASWVNVLASVISMQRLYHKYD